MYMRYLASGFLSAFLLISGCGEEQLVKKPEPQTVREISVSGKLGRVHTWQVDAKTDYIEVSWSEDAESLRRKYILSANQGRRFYDIGELEGNFDDEYPGFTVDGKATLDAENPNACRELIRLSKTANRVRDSVLAENNITDEPVSSTPKFISIGSEKYQIGD